MCGGGKITFSRYEQQITRQQTERAFRICREEGVDTRGYFMVGYYDAVPQDIEQMIDFAAGLGLDWASFSVATALPATDLYNVAQERGYVNGDFWKQYTIDGGGVIPQLETETFSAEQLRAYRTKAYMKFYLRPDLVRRKFSESEGQAELMEMAGGAQVLGEIIKSTVLKVVPSWFGQVGNSMKNRICVSLFQVLPPRIKINGNKTGRVFIILKTFY